MSQPVPRTSHGEYVGLELDFWDDDSVGAFEPEKLLRQLREAFPDAVVDPTDTQRARLLQLLDLWAKNETAVGQYDTLVRQAWWQYQTCGPQYRFAIPFPIAHLVNGSASRLSVHFWLPTGLPPEYRERLLTFLSNLRMGQPKLATLDARDEVSIVLLDIVKEPNAVISNPASAE